MRAPAPRGSISVNSEFNFTTARDCRTATSNSSDSQPYLSFAITNLKNSTARAQSAGAVEKKPRASTQAAHRGSAR